ncbi:hypothetical protein TRAPUB_3222 [Trametes pubescens]|uniref:Uncharacterized protein n=1 Tax=Trametes pubescens TaxID=154538 RepID=A0A1M2VEA4_TRAPU|nr:hypothetical protein TRAPUB_3222 [Trametes pubescens]
MRATDRSPTESYGSGGSSKQAGCCNSCCSKSFDEDDFSNGRNAPKTASSQPAPQKPMSDKPAAVAAQPDSS